MKEKEIRGDEITGKEEKKENAEEKGWVLEENGTCRGKEEMKNRKEKGKTGGGEKKR